MGDLLTGGLLLAVLWILSPTIPLDGDRYLSDCVGQALGPYLAVALGFLLALRRGAIDLSVWAVMGVCGMAAAGLINMGLWPAAAFAAAGMCGAGIGSLNALLTVRLKIPSALATLAVALLLIGMAGQLAGPARTVAVDDRTFESWRLRQSSQYQDDPPPKGKAMPARQRQIVIEETLRPLVVTQMLLSASIFSLALAAVLGGSVAKRYGREMSPRKTLAAAMIGSGALAGFGGACWLVLYGAAPVPTRLFDDLRVPAAAMLAGGVFLAGYQRSVLAGLMLPPALLAATIWQQEAGLPRWHGEHVFLIVLIVQVMVFQLAAARWPAGPDRRTGKCGIFGTILAAAGILALASSANIPSYSGPLRYAACIIGPVMSVAALALLIAGLRRSRHINPAR